MTKAARIELLNGNPQHLRNLDDPTRLGYYQARMDAVLSLSIPESEKKELIGRIQDRIVKLEEIVRRGENDSNYNQQNG